MDRRNKMIILTAITEQKIAVHARDIATMKECEGRIDFDGLVENYTEVSLYSTTGHAGYNVKESIKEILRLSYCEGK